MDMSESPLWIRMYEGDREEVASHVTQIILKRDHCRPSIFINTDHGLFSLSHLSYQILGETTICTFKL